MHKSIGELTTKPIAFPCLALARQAPRPTQHPCAPLNSDVLTPVDHALQPP